MADPFGLFTNKMLFIDQEVELKLTIARLRIEVANLKKENEQIKNAPFLKRLKYLFTGRLIE